MRCLESQNEYIETREENGKKKNVCDEKNVSDLGHDIIDSSP